MDRPGQIIFRFYIWLSAFLLVIMLTVLCIFLMKNSGYSLLKYGAGDISRELFSPVVGTITVTLFAVLLASPVGVITGVFISEYTRGKVQEVLVFLFKVLGGVPSIVVGIFGFIIILTANKFFGYGLRPCLLVSGISLSILVLPYIVHSTILALRSIPFSRRITGLSLGAGKSQNIFLVLIPGSLRALFSGIILAIGRAAEDTAVILLTGVAAMAGLPSSLMKPYEALPFYIYITSSEYRDMQELSTVYIASSMIIFICLFMIFAANRVEGLVSAKLNR